MKNRIIRVFKLLSVLLISLVVFSSVYAQEISLKDVKVVDKNIEIEDPVISGNEITNEINFNEVGNFVTFEIIIQNNDSYDYAINNIEDNNKNKNISFSYIYSKTDIKKNSEYKFKVTVLYKNRLENVEEINLKDTKLTINLIREDGKESNIVVNPTTGDSILKYILLLIIVLVGIVLKQKKKVFYKVLFIIPILLLPFVIFANESYKQEVIFKDIKVKGVMLPYEVTIKVPGEEPIVRTITYGDEIGELPEVSVDGYDFNGWQDSKGNPVDEHTKVTEEMEISPKLSPIIYTITYDLQGGTTTGNKETYTVETDTFTLVNPTKSGYSFSGWTGLNGEVLQTEVTVYKGTTGNLSYKAHYRQTENIPYKVIHRKQKLTLDEYDVEEEQTGRGSVGTTVRPETRQYEGFTSPEEQDLLITDDGLASLTYDYNRIIYSYEVDSNTNSTIPSGDYPYGTEATITANTVPGYTFLEWSDGETTNPRNIIISEGTTNITPVYKANEDTAYTVIHYQMDIDGIHYTEYERENKTGTTGEEVTSLPKTYEGFTSPSPKTGVIKGDGSTVIEYQYRRNDITIVINIPGEEPIEKTVKYDDVIGELPTPSKDGYTFDGYEDGDGNPVDENTKVHGEMTITPVFSPIEYTISYDLNGGLNNSENPDKYTIESNNITLKDASRNGYTFIGWTGSNGTIPQKNVVIEKGTTGNKNYKANFSKSADTLDITLDVVSYPYDGNPKTPEVTIKDGDVVLVEGRDYTVEYSDNVNAGEATVKVTMTGSVNPDTGASYEGEKEVHFTILAVPPLVELINTSKEYTGEPIVFTEEDVRITPASGGEISFKYYTDISCEHEVSSIEEAGTYYVVAHVGANGNYSESDSEPTIITIERKEIEIPEVTTTFTYTSVEQELLSDTEYYTVSNNIAKNAGTYDVIVTPTSNYKWSDGTVTPKVVTVTINPYDINNGSVVPVEEYTYDGSEKKPTPSVIVPIPSSVDTTTLTSSDVDYTYENNINAGEAAAIITGKGNYTGTITKTFEIEKADGSIELSRTSDNIIYGTASITVDVLNATGEVEATTTTSGVSISVNGNTITITGLSNIDSGETVNIKVKAKTSTNYKEAEETYSITVSDAAITGGSVTITGVNGVGETLTASVEDTTPVATYTYEWYRKEEDSMSGGTKIDGETSNTYTLTNNDVGKYIYVVVTASKQNYTPITFKDKVDAENNKTDKTKIEVEIPVSTNTCKNLTYNGDTQILTNESGEGYAYINNSGVNAGEYTVEARLEENYMWSDYTFNNKPVTCVINKKNVTIKADNQTKVYDGTPLNADTTCTDKNSDLISGHLPVCTSSGTITNVGNETKVLNTVIIKQNETDLTNNYNITKENGDLSVTTRDITCTSSSNTKVYDGTPLTDNTGICTNLVPNQTATFNNTGTATNVSDTVEGNNTLESVTITDQDSVNVTTNYNIAKHNGTLTITRANSTCEITNNPILYYPGDNIGSITYACTGDGELSVTSSSNVITVSNVTRISSALTSTNTGTTTITVSKAEGPNYNSTSVTKEITVNASIYHVIFDKNDEAATGVMDNQDITYGVATALNENQYSKSGYVFVGWNTEPDGTGTPYTDEQSVLNLATSGNVTLHAQWILAQAMFNKGQNVNAKMKKLAGSGASAYSTDTNVTSIQKSSTKPDISQMTSDNIVSISNSTYNTPIYMWYDNGTIYWWSEDDKPSLNSNGVLMFGYFEGLTSFSFNDFDLSTLTNADGMFYQCYSLASVDFSSVDTCNLENMDGMFARCSSLTSLNLSSLNTSKVTNMQELFYSCSSLTSLDLTGLDTSKVTNMYAMFAHCASLTSLDLTSFNTNRVTNMQSTFDNCTNLTTIYTSSLFDTSNVTKSSYMFINDSKLVGGLGTTYDSNHKDKAYAHFDGGVSDPGYFTAGTGWRFVNSTTSQSLTDQQWSYFENGVRIESGWRMLDDLYGQEQKYYFVNGIAHLGWLNIGDDYYYLSTEDDDGNGYVNAGAYRSQSKVINGKSYAFDADGKCLNYTGDDMYTIIYNANGGTTSYSTKNLGPNEALGTLPTASREGYVFTGWWTDLTGGVQIDENTVPNAGLTYYAHWDQIYSLTFDSNEGEFSPSVTTNLIKYCNGSYYDSTSYLTPTKTGYVLVGWNSEPDGTGSTTYVDEQDVLSDISSLDGETLYAQWIEARAMFDIGQNVNVKMKRLAGNASESYFSADTNITSIEKSSTKPDISSMTSDNIVSISNSTYNTPIYMWFDNGTIYWWSEDDTPNLNINSRSMFYSIRSISTLDLSSFDTSNVTNMELMFAYCISLISLDFGENFDTSQVTSMSNMFSECSSLASLDLSSFETDNVKGMMRMFDDCSSLTNLDLSSFDTSNVTTMSNMFYGCKTLQNLVISSFNTNNVKDMSWMFYNCNSLQNLDLRNFNTSQVTSMSNMFYGCKLLQNLNTSSFNTSQVTNMSNMFYYCISLTNLDLRNFNTSQVTNMADMFCSCNSLQNLDISSFNTSNVTNMRGMFCECNSLQNLDTSSFNTSQVTDMSSMFEGCKNLNSLDLGSFNTSQVTNMADMFCGCKSLQNLDTSSFNTSNVTNMRGMFCECNSLQNLDTSSFNTSQVTDMSSMFEGCKNLNSLDLGSFNTSQVTNMLYMFRESSSLLILDISSFDTSNVTTMKWMFFDCSKLETIYASNSFVTNKIDITDSTNMFYECRNLVGGMGTTFSSSNHNKNYAHIDGGPDNPGYFTDINGVAKITYNSNCGTGSMSSQISDYNTSVTLRTNTFTRSGYLFDNWNTSSDGTGTSYTDGDTITLNSSVTLYAQWTKIEAIFDTGQNVNKKMKRLAGNSSATFSTSDTNITSIQKSPTKPDISAMTSDNIVSISNTTYNTPIYMWYESGTIYWWSEDGEPSLNQDSSYMFYNCSSLTSLNLGDKFDTSNVTDMSSMFFDCISLSALDLGDKFDTSNVTDMSGMFYNCSSLTSLDLEDNFDTNNVTTMNCMFYNCSSLTSLDLGDKFDTSNVIDMSYMFNGCKSLTSLDLTHFNTSNVITMSFMFSSCENIISLDLSSFDTSKVTKMENMFYNNGNLTTIYASNGFATNNVTNSNYMFYYNSSSLKGGSGTTWSSSNPTDKTYAHIDEGTSNPGYFTYKAAPTGGNISRFINAFKPKNLLTNKFILLGEVLAIITIGCITFVIMHKQRKKIK